MKKILSVLSIITFIFLPLIATAQNEVKQYEYESLDFKITVNQDSTFDVVETQTFNFQGEFHAAERYIPFNKIDDVKNIKVFDQESGKFLQYSSKRLDKGDPSSWGKYTTYRKDGAQYIEWYYDEKDSKHTWTLYYTILGGISFLNDHDELYWDLFEEYTVPVNTVTATVIIPDNTADVSQLSKTLYFESGENERAEIINNKEFRFSISNISPSDPVTIAAGWPKGLVSLSEYFKQAFWIYLPYVLIPLVILVCCIIGWVYWYFTERHNKGRGTIVPEYDPPQNLRPAMAEALIKEGISDKAWPATIVDLAVRGYLKITEEKTSTWGRVGIIVAMVFILLFVGIPLFTIAGSQQSLAALVPLIFFALVLFIIFKKHGATIAPKDYILERLKDPVGDPNLEEYEKKFLAILGPRFSTKELKHGGKSRKQQMYEAMKELKQELYAETETDTKAYSVPLTHTKYIGYILAGIFIAIWIGSFVGGSGIALLETFGISPAYLVLVFVTVVSVGILYGFMRYNPRLSHEGHIMREQWLGFKMYLETAERYRMQNLTPEIFEKYLPYAMIFGIEKKWARAFEGLHMQAPGWYTGTHAASFSSTSGGGTGFSPSAFSSSFASSLSSSFSSSGGGASGGGGSAGGGGGGGGGGAS